MPGRNPWETLTGPGRVECARLKALRPALELRGRLLQAVRDFFRVRDFLEVETPVRIRAPAPELHIEAEPAGDAFLRPSPELHMKRLLAAGYPRLFQLGPCFRKGECGSFHRPEFVMLEWYRANADYLELLADAKSLLESVARAVLGRDVLQRQGRTIELSPMWEVFKVSDLFRVHAGWDPAEAYDDDRFARDLVEKIEPFLPREHPVVLMDYPAGQAALARLKPDNPKVAERWELYVDGVELANAFSELTDPAEQRLRFARAREQRREQGLADYPPDEDFLEALDVGLPPCAGVALGFDRLALLFLGAESLDEVRAFEA